MVDVVVVDHEWNDEYDVDAFVHMLVDLYLRLHEAGDLAVLEDLASQDGERPEAA